MGSSAARGLDLRQSSTAPYGVRRGARRRGSRADERQRQSLRDLRAARLYSTRAPSAVAKRPFSS